MHARLGRTTCVLPPLAPRRLGRPALPPPAAEKSLIALAQAFSSVGYQPANTLNRAALTPSLRAGRLETRRSLQAAHGRLQGPGERPAPASGIFPPHRAFGSREECCAAVPWERPIYSPPAQFASRESGTDADAMRAFWSGSSRCGSWAAVRVRTSPSGALVEAVQSPPCPGCCNARAPLAVRCVRTRHVLCRMASLAGPVVAVRRVHKGRLAGVVFEQMCGQRAVKLYIIKLEFEHHGPACTEAAGRACRLL